MRKEPFCNGLIQNPQHPTRSGFSLPSYHFSLPPSHLSISQTVVHLPPCAAVPICSLLTWPFTSDPIPTILIETESHYGGAPAPVGKPVSVCVSVCMCDRPFCVVKSEYVLCLTHLIGLVLVCFRCLCVLLLLLYHYLYACVHFGHKVRIMYIL